MKSKKHRKNSKKNKTRRKIQKGGTLADIPKSYTDPQKNNAQRTAAKKVNYLAALKSFMLKNPIQTLKFLILMNKAEKSGIANIDSSLINAELSYLGPSLNNLTGKDAAEMLTRQLDNPEFSNMLKNMIDDPNVSNMLKSLMTENKYSGLRSGENEEDLKFSSDECRDLHEDLHESSPKIDSTRTKVERNNFSDIFRSIPIFGGMIENAAYPHFNAATQTVSILIEDAITNIYEKILDCKKPENKKVDCDLGTFVESNESTDALPPDNQASQTPPPPPSPPLPPPPPSPSPLPPPSTEKGENDQSAKEDELTSQCKIQCMFEKIVIKVVKDALQTVNWESSTIFEKKKDDEVLRLEDIKLETEKTELVVDVKEDDEKTQSATEIHSSNVEENQNGAVVNLVKTFISPDFIEKSIRKALQSKPRARNDADDNEDEIYIDDLLKQKILGQEGANKNEIQNHILEKISTYIDNLTVKEVASSLEKVNFVKEDN